MSTAAPATKQKGRKGLVGAVIAVGVLLLASLVALGLALSGMITVPGITQASGELVLQGVDEAGRDPFATGLAGPAAGTAPTPVAKPVVSAAGAAVSGGSVGLYGGTNDNSRCDPAQLVSFLGANPGKAQAWVAALNADPNLRWTSATLTTADIPAYVAQLTPLVLLTDTVVTNHGYAGGSPTAFQAVLQAGTAVLVDRFGVPRARCLCGNPLIPPTPIAGTPTVTGTVWPGFDINLTVNIIQVQTVINVFQVVPYPGGGAPITINAGQCDPANPASCAFNWVGAGPQPTPGATGAATPAPTGTATPTPTDTPTAAPTTPADVPQVAPVGGTPSFAQPGDAPQVTGVRFVNNSSVPVDLWWNDFSGVPQFQGRIPAGGTYDMGNGYTYDGHVWSLTSGTDAILAEFTIAGSGDYVYP